MLIHNYVQFSSRPSLALLALVLLTSFFFSCNQEELPVVQAVNEDGIEIPVFKEIPFALETRGNLPYFKDPQALLEAIQFTDAYHEPEIVAWCNSLPVDVLYSLGAAFVNGEISQIPMHAQKYFFTEDMDGQLASGFASSPIARFVSPDGLLQMGDRIVFVSNDYQVSTSLDRLEELRSVVRSNGDLSVFDVNIDNSTVDNLRGNNLQGRADRVVSFDCGVGVLSTNTIYSHQHTNSEGNRKHAMYFQYRQFTSPQAVDPSETNGSQEFAWQAIELRTISYKGGSNQYRTRHDLNWNFQVQLDSDPTVNKSYLFSRNSIYGKDFKRIFFVTDLPGTGARSRDDATLYSLKNVWTGSTSNPSYGTWGTHSGMGGDKIRWFCS